VGDRQEVLEGLRPGEQVVTTGQGKLVDGSPVRIKE
jgi:preprotein translocase subunit YajC